MPGDMGSIKYSFRSRLSGLSSRSAGHWQTADFVWRDKLDVSRRVERSLGIALPPCRIVFVLPGPSVLSTANVHPWAAIFLPLHIVISGNGAQTEILVQNRIHADPEAAAPALVAPVIETQAQISVAIEAIAMRPSLVG